MSESESATSEAKSTSTVDRADIIGTGVLKLAKWSLAIVAIAIGLWVIGFVIAKLWVIILPVVLAIVISTVLWPPTRAMTKRGVPPAFAAMVTILSFVAVLAGLIALIVPSIVDQSPELADKSTDGVNKVRDWLQGPPLNIRDEQLESAVHAIVSKLQASGEQIATGVFSGVSAATSALVTLALVLVLSFFFIKDGPRFIPWLHRVVGNRSGRHVEEVFTRVWTSLGGFIRTQALVALIDAIFIGIGLVILGVPLAFVLVIITFLGAFIPIVGAFVAGALAVLVALVGNGFTTALIVLAIIIAVQQIEGNVLQPMLQSRSMNLHAVIVLLAVTAGGSLYGIIGAFLAVPAASVAAVVIRYIGEQIDTASAGEPVDVKVTPPPEPPAENPSVLE